MTTSHPRSEQGQVLVTLGLAVSALGMSDFTVISVVDVTEALIVDSLECILRKIGVDPGMLSSAAGHAQRTIAGYRNRRFEWRFAERDARGSADEDSITAKRALAQRRRAARDHPPARPAVTRRRPSAACGADSARCRAAR